MPAVLPAPPSTIPQQPLFAINPSPISPCLFRTTYIWLRNGSSFWFFPIFAGFGLVLGFRWTGSFWIFYAIPLSDIVAFACV